MRSFSKNFTDTYLELLKAGAKEDREGCIKWSQELGFLTGLESEVFFNIILVLFHRL